VEEEENYEVKGETHFGPPPAITEDDHIEQLMDVPETTWNPTTVAPYPTFTKHLIGSVVPAPKKMYRDLRSIQSNHGAYMTEALPETKLQAYKKEFTMIQAAFNCVAGFDDGRDTPKTYKEVLKHKNQAGWWASMKKEFHTMEAKGVWEIVLMSSMPSEIKEGRNGWVHTEKDDRSLRSRTVAQGFSQLPGKVFADRHAPVMRDLSLRLSLIIWVLMKLCTGQFDIETAFLQSDLDEEVYMRIPEGYVRYMLKVHIKNIDPSTHV
jgi:Reverse transcriptase (RNA-dependent DNA polymerase)